MRPLKSLALAAIAIAAACSIYDSTLLVEAGPADVAVIDAAPDVDPCDHAEPPARPTKDDPSDAGDVEFVTTLRTVDFNLVGDSGVLGFDLDHTCTCPGVESCVPATNAPQHCDDSRGRDNAGGALIQQFSSLTTALNANKVNDNVSKGINSMVLRVRNWNGTPNDTLVALDVFVSNGTVPLSDAGTNPTPKHDGTDQWAIDPTSLTGNAPPYIAVNQDLGAYVASGVLVANVSFPFSVGAAFGPNFLRLDGALLVGAITQSQFGYSVAGVITGRWDTRNLLTGLQGAKDPFNPGQYLCGTDTTYLGFKAAICGASDIARLSTNDNTNAPCDALSTAVGFATEPAQLGGMLSGGVQPSPCGATWSDQCGN